MPKIRRLGLILCLALTVGLEFLCPKVYSSTPHNFSKEIIPWKIYNADYDTVWKLLLQEVSQFEILSANKILGQVKTRWIDDTLQEREFNPGETLLARRFNLTFGVLRVYLRKQTMVKVTIYKNVQIIKSMGEDFSPIPSDGVTEKVLFYRLFRALSIHKTIQAARRKKIQGKSSQYENALEKGTKKNKGKGNGKGKDVAKGKELNNQSDSSSNAAKIAPLAPIVPLTPIIEDPEELNRTTEEDAFPWESQSQNQNQNRNLKNDQNLEEANPTTEEVIEPQDLQEQQDQQDQTEAPIKNSEKIKPAKKSKPIQNEDLQNLKADSIENIFPEYHHQERSSGVKANVDDLGIEEFIK